MAMINQWTIRRAVTTLGCGVLGLAGGYGVSGVGAPLGHPVPAPSSRPRLPVPDSTGGTSRIVVGEYLTGVACVPCQAHEMAFDSLLHRYPATQFIALAYHQTYSLPLADPAESLFARVNRWYGMTGHPGMLPGNGHWDDWIDGHATSTDNLFVQLQAPGPLSGTYYHAMATAIDAERQKAPGAVLQVEAHPKGGTLVTRVRVQSLAPGHPDVYVRICVVEDTVRLTRSPSSKSGLRLDHYMVVREAARDATHPMGLPLHGPGTVSYTFDLAKAQRRLLHYWELGKAPVPQTADDSTMTAIEDVKVLFSVFSDQRNWLIDPTRLHVVAVVQDAHTGDVLQAAMIPVDAGPHGTLLTLR